MFFVVVVVFSSSFKLSLCREFTTISAVWGKTPRKSPEELTVSDPCPRSAGQAVARQPDGGHAPGSWFLGAVLGPGCTVRGLPGASSPVKDGRRWTQLTSKWVRESSGDLIAPLLPAGSM